MFVSILLSVCISQLLVIGIIVGFIMFYNKYINPKKRDYDQEYLFNSASSTLLEVFLQYRFPNSVSDKTVPIPDGTYIPAPMNYNQHCIPLDSHELKMRTEAIQKFLLINYGNIRNFHKEVIDVFESDDTDTQNSKESEMSDSNVEMAGNYSPSGSDDGSDVSENELPRKYTKKESKSNSEHVKIDPKVQKDSPKEDKHDENEPKHDKKESEHDQKEAKNNQKESKVDQKETKNDQKESKVDQKESKVEQKESKERITKNKPKQMEDDRIIVEKESKGRIVKQKPKFMTILNDDDDDQIIVEKEPPGEKSDSDLSENNNIIESEIDVDDDYIAKLIEGNGIINVKKTKKTDKLKQKK